MKAPKCKLCGNEHWGLCGDHERKGSLQQRVTESTAARTDVHVPAAGASELRVAALHPSKTPSPKQVDTNKTKASDERRGAAGIKPRPSILNKEAPPVDIILASAEAAAAHLAPVTKKGTPRQRAPKGTFDRKAYQREAAKKRRAAKLLEKNK